MVFLLTLKEPQSKICDLCEGHLKTTESPQYTEVTPAAWIPFGNLGYQLFECPTVACTVESRGMVPVIRITPLFGQKNIQKRSTGEFPERFAAVSTCRKVGPRPLPAGVNLGVGEWGMKKRETSECRERLCKIARPGTAKRSRTARHGQARPGTTRHAPGCPF